jgi:hypothetical protein
MWELNKIKDTIWRDFQEALGFLGFPQSLLREHLPSNDTKYIDLVF